MKKVLMIYKSFAPVNNCGSIPNTALVRALVREPVAAEVLTGPLDAWEQADPALLEGLEHLKIHRVPNSRLYEKTLGSWRRSMTASGRKEQLKQRRSPLAALAGTLFFCLRDLDWYGQARRWIRHNLEPGAYDVVLSSYPEEDALLTGRYLKRRGYAKSWIADFRDPMWYDLYPRGCKALRENRQRRYVQEADHVTVVSRGAGEKLRAGAEKLTCLYNGFDPWERLPRPAKQDKILRFCYAGSLYGGQRDPGPMFEALHDLTARGKIDKSRIQCLYAGREWAVFREKAAQWDLADRCRSCGELSHTQVLQLLADCDIPLICTHNTKEDRGVVTGKLFSLLHTEKPLLLLVGGTLPDSEAGQIVRDCGAGFVLEPGDDLDRLRAWIWDRYREKQKTGAVQSTIDWEKRAQYGYDRLAHILYNVIDKL